MIIAGPVLFDFLGKKLFSLWAPQMLLLLRQLVVFVARTLGLHYLSVPPPNARAIPLTIVSPSQEPVFVQIVICREWHNL